jgi:hypothetical protein
MTMDMETIKRLDVKFRPHKEYRFWLYDPEGDGMTYYRTEEARDEAAKTAIANYLEDGEWWDEVEGVVAGEVTHAAQEVDVLMRPTDLDEEDCDGEGIYWGPDMDKRCNYALVSMSPNATSHRGAACGASGGLPGCASNGDTEK